MLKSKKIMLKRFEMEEAAAIESQKIAHMVEDDCVGTEIPLANISGSTLWLVMEYCKKHEHVTDEIKEEIKKWDAEFTKAMDQSTLFDVMLAAYDLHIKSLVDLTCQTVADMLSARTPDEIRAYFNIDKDLSPEEEEEIRRDYQKVSVS